MGLEIATKKRALNGMFWSNNATNFGDNKVTKYYDGYAGGTTSSIAGGTSPGNTGMEVYMYVIGKESASSLDLSSIATDANIITALNANASSSVLGKIPLINQGEAKIKFDQMVEAGTSVTVSNRNISDQMIIPAGYSAGIVVLILSAVQADNAVADDLIAWFKLSQSGDTYVYPAQGTLAISAAEQSSGGWKITLQEGV